MCESNCFDCIMYETCSPSKKSTTLHGKVCPDFMDLESYWLDGELDLYGESIVNDNWTEMSYYRNEKGCLDTEDSEYEKFDWCNEGKELERVKDKDLKNIEISIEELLLFYGK
jgi:hypothetical protein